MGSSSPSSVENNKYLSCHHPVNNVLHKHHNYILDSLVNSGIPMDFLSNFQVEDADVPSYGIHGF